MLTCTLAFSALSPPPALGFVAFAFFIIVAENPSLVLDN
jgi:hypothetical protein